jgi:hypothetical protein
LWKTFVLRSKDLAPGRSVINQGTGVFARSGDEDICGIYFAGLLELGLCNAGFGTVEQQWNGAQPGFTESREKADEGAEEVCQGAAQGAEEDVETVAEGYQLSEAYDLSVWGAAPSRDRL